MVGADTRATPPAEATLIGHGDIAPYDVCFDGDTLVGVFDWDMAGPTSVDHELGFIAWNCVPLFRPMPDSTRSGATWAP